MKTRVAAAGSKPAPDENMKQITIRVDPDLLAAISERQSVAIVAISERQSMAIVKQPRRTFAGERQAEAFIAAPRIACKLLKQRETKNRRREGTAPVGSALSPCESFMCCACFAPALRQDGLQCSVGPVRFGKMIDGLEAQGTTPKRCARLCPFCASKFLASY